MCKMETAKHDECTDGEMKDNPLVEKLEELDDKFLALEKEYEAEVQKLMVAYTAKQQPLLDERKTLLCPKEDSDCEKGTPALVGFWRTALQNHPAFEETIHKWDEPVLDYLQDIEKSHIDDSDSSKGFKLVFRFAPNPFFEQTELIKEYVTEIENPYYGEVEVKEIKGTEIAWKEGQDVTVEKVVKKIKGGGAKKAKQKNKEKVEARPSIFRDFFNDLNPESKLTDEMRQRCHQMGMMEDEDSDEEEANDPEYVEYLMDADYQIGVAVRDNIIPFAIRWYTGEAAPEDDDDEDDDEDEEEDDDDSDDSGEK